MLNVGKVYRLMFFLYLFFVCMLPVYKYTMVIKGIDTPINYIVLCGLVLFCVPLFFYKNKDSNAQKIFLIFTFIFGIALISVIRNDYLIDRPYEYYSLLITWCNMALAFLVSKVMLFKTLDYKKTVKMISRLLTFTILFYIFWWVYEYHMETRLTGMIGVSSVVYLPMVLVLAIHLSDISNKLNRIESTFGSVIAIIGILLTNSRAGLISLILLILFFLVQRISIRKIFIISLLACVCLSVLIKFSNADRYQSFQDPKREQNIQTSLTIVTSSVENFVLGSGYGSIWPYNYSDSQISDNEMVFTDYGMVLHHPHSSFLKVFVELGLIGLLSFLSIFIIILQELFKSWRNKNSQKMYILYGVFCTCIISFSTDLYLFQNWQISLIWWFFLFVGIYYPQKKKVEIN